MDWEGANSRDRQRAAKRIRASRATGLREAAISDYARKHDLACFVCGSSDGPWAKTGVSKRGPWGICLPCARRPSE